MKTLLTALALTGLLAAAPVALAQATKPTAAKPADPKVDPKKPADPKVASKASITIKPDAKGRYRLLIKDSDGKGFLMTAGNGFETEKEAKEALDELKTILGAVKPTVEKADEEKKDK